MIEETIKNLGFKTLGYLQNGQIPDCIGLVMVTLEGTPEDFQIRVTPQGLCGPIAALIQHLIDELHRGTPAEDLANEISNETEHMLARANNT